MNYKDDISSEVYTWCEEPFVTGDPLLDLDGNAYTSVRIGSQEWLVENWRCTKYADGSAIPNVTADGSPVNYTDFFLPSRDELNAMYTELHLYGLGSFDITGSPHYWTSTEDRAIASDSQNFSTGAQNINAGKSLPYKVRACRSFAGAPGDYSLRDIGPAGGYVFAYSGGLYYEAAPSDSAATSWSNITGTEIGATAQGTAIGTGITNTAAIIGQAGHTNSAAKVCDDLSVTNGTDGWLGNTTGAYCYYDNDIANKTIYGALYNWYAVNKGLIYLSRGGVQEPNWRTANDADWNALITYCGGTTMAGSLLKESGTINWTTPNTGAIDMYEFKGLPGGWRRYTGLFEIMYYLGIHWSLDEVDTTTANAISFSYSNMIALKDSYEKRYGFSIRAVR